MEDTTSLILNLCFKNPINPPTKAPTTKQIKITNGFAIGAANVEYPIVIEATNPAANICPETPMLNKPAFNATATAKAAKIIGVQ